MDFKKKYLKYKKKYFNLLEQHGGLNIKDLLDNNKLLGLILENTFKDPLLKKLKNNTEYLRTKDAINRYLTQQNALNSLKDSSIPPSKEDLEKNKNELEERENTMNNELNRFRKFLGNQYLTNVIQSDLKEVNDLQLVVDGKESIIVKKTQDNEELNEQVTKLKSQNKELNKLFNNAKVEALNTRQTKPKSRVKNIKKINSLQKENTGLIKTIDDMKEEKENLKQKVRESSAKIVEINKKLKNKEKEMEKQKESFTKDFNQKKERKKFYKKLSEEKEKELTILQEKTNKLEKINKGLNKLTKKLNIENSDLKGAVKELADELSSVSPETDVMEILENVNPQENEKVNTLKGVVSNLIELNKKMLDDNYSYQKM